MPNRSTRLIAGVCVCLGAACGGVEPPPIELPTWLTFDVQANGPDDIWLAGDVPAPTFGSALVHCDGETWSEVERFDDTLQQVAGRGGEAWAVTREVLGLGESRYHLFVGTIDGFDEVPGPDEEAEGLRLLRGPGEDLWVLTLASSDDVCAVEHTVFRRRGEEWERMTSFTDDISAGLDAIRDGDDRVWTRSTPCAQRVPNVIRYWSEVEGTVEVGTPPGMDAVESLQLDADGDVVALFRDRFFRYEDGRWVALPFETHADVRAVRNQSVTPQGLWLSEHNETSTRCESWSCDTSTIVTRGVLRFEGADGRAYERPVSGLATGARSQARVIHEEPNRAWAIGSNLVIPIDVP